MAGALLFLFLFLLLLFLLLSSRVRVRVRVSLQAKRYWREVNFERKSDYSYDL